LPIGDGCLATVENVEEVSAIVERLERIDRLRADGTTPGMLLEELRLLLSEAEAWARLEGGEAGERAVDRLREALAAGALVTR
jgi:hypothetical protein